MQQIYIRLHNTSLHLRASAEGQGEGFRPNSPLTFNSFGHKETQIKRFADLIETMQESRYKIFSVPFRELLETPQSNSPPLLLTPPHSIYFTPTPHSTSLNLTQPYNLGCK
eukprot:GHVN01071286.1.p1 GENE.GHVN01071286.1~~GHVN01071286.1.p1  ORF type:complete len:111 (+),score=29.40 GHVN01071286.1:60-392(+)